MLEVNEGYNFRSSLGALCAKLSLLQATTRSVFLSGSFGVSRRGGFGVGRRGGFGAGRKGGFGAGRKGGFGVSRRGSFGVGGIEEWAEVSESGRITGFIQRIEVFNFFRHS